MRRLAACLILLAACGPSSMSSAPDARSILEPDAADGPPDAPIGPLPDGAEAGCGQLPNCYSVYAHGDHTLYVVDLQAKMLKTVGAFKAPLVMVGTAMKEDVITDLAVAPDNTIYVVSETALYTADPTDGHVTRIGSSAACGTKTVALTATPDGKVYAGDFSGALCEIDLAVSPPAVKAPVTMQDGYALTGDMVAVEDGTVYGTAYKTADAANTGTQKNNVLVTVDLTTGAVTPVGAGSGYPKLFGASYALGKVFGFSHDGTGNVVEIDRTTGVGTIYATFTDPGTGKGISFAGAGVNALVQVN
jgi:hypothetical protein